MGQANSDILCFFTEFNTQTHLHNRVHQADQCVTKAQYKAAVFFSRGNYPAAKKTLEKAISLHQQSPDKDTKCLWLMLFSLFQQVGDKNAFSALSFDFVDAFETSPPNMGELPTVFSY